MARSRRTPAEDVDNAQDVTPSDPTLAAPTWRTAMPAREFLRFTPRTAVAASALSTAAVLGTIAVNPTVNPAMTAGSAAAIALVIGGKIGGRTLGQWLSIRRGRKVLPDQAALFSRDGVGVVFDGRSVTALVEITPRPWQVTSVSPTGSSASAVISADTLRRQLRQYDIPLSRLDVICSGYKFAARDDAAGVLDALIGPVSVPLGGSTVIAVSLDLEADILGASYARTRRESLPDGLCQALTIAATGVCYSLAEQGFGGRLMNAQQIRDFHDAVLVQVARPLAAPGWRNCGPTSGVHTRTYIPARGHWNADSAGSWNHLQAHRQYTTLTLTPQGGGSALAQPLVTYLVRGSDVLAKGESYGLRTAGGQQVAGLAQALPIATRIPLRSTGVIIDDQRRLGFGIPAGGAGLFVGSQKDKTRVFVAVSPADEPLWLAGPQLFAMQMVARLSTQDQRIAVMIDEPRWQQLVSHINSPALTLGTLASTPADVVVCTPQWWERNRSLTTSKAVLLVTEGPPGRGATNSLTVETVEGRSEISVRADEQSLRVLWELTPMERRVLLGGVDASSAAVSPTTAAPLRLPQAVSPTSSASPVGRPQRRSTGRPPVVRSAAAAVGSAPRSQSIPRISATETAAATLADTVRPAVPPSAKPPASKPESAARVPRTAAPPVNRSETPNTGPPPDAGNGRHHFQGEQP